MKPIIRSYLTELNLGNTLPGNNTNLTFNDYPQLRDIFICGVQVFDINQVTVSPSGRVIVPALTGIVLTLLDKDNMEQVYQYPLYDLNPFNNAGFYRDFRPFPLQLTKSYVTILDNTGLAANESIIFNFLYFNSKDASKI
jgi:hypothetical protein